MGTNNSIHILAWNRIKVSMFLLSVFRCLYSTKLTRIITSIVINHHSNSKDISKDIKFNSSLHLCSTSQ